MDWDKLKTFYTVARAKSFSRAVDQLNLSQSAISRQISSLEESLNTKLFQRHARGLYLTKQGEILQQTASEVFTKVAMTEALLQQDRNEAKGPLKVATTMALSNIWLTQYLKEFMDTYTQINLTVMGNDEDYDLASLKADVAIRPAASHQQDVIQHHLMTFNMRLYASREYLQEFGIPQDVEDLAYHRLITFGDESIRPYSSINWILRVGMKQGQVRAPYMCINSSAGLVWAATNGVGIIALEQEFPGFEKLGLVPVLPDLKGPSIDIYYVYPEQLRDSKRVKVFGEFLAGKIAEDKRNR